MLARVAVALGDPAVRDVCLGFAAGRDPGVDPEHATRLWWQLTRALPAPEVAQPATLLAFASPAPRRGSDPDRGARAGRCTASPTAASAELFAGSVGGDEPVRPWCWRSALRPRTRQGAVNGTGARAR